MAPESSTTQDILREEDVLYDLQVPALESELPTPSGKTPEFLT